jgi:hypothetical protein
MLMLERSFAPKAWVIWIEHHMTWSFIVYDVAMSSHSSSHHPYMLIWFIMSSLVHTKNSFGAYTCNRCAEDRDMSEVLQGVSPEVGVHSGAGGPVLRTQRRRRNRSWSRTWSHPPSVKASPGAL